MVKIEDVKTALGITGSYQDATIQGYVNEVVDFLKSSDIPENNITTGIVARGVADLWNYGSGEGKLSPYFMQRTTQLYEPNNK